MTSNPHRSPTMEGLILILIAAALPAILGILALRLGVDSRESVGDDRARPAWR